jgi:hypothetical protein
VARTALGRLGTGGTGDFGLLAVRPLEGGPALLTLEIVRADADVAAGAAESVAEVFLVLEVITRGALDVTSFGEVAGDVLLRRVVLAETGALLGVLGGRSFASFLLRSPMDPTDTGRIPVTTHCAG